ncbi:MAG: TIR domain-containing protein [Gammaproteobacteria bacterium]|nr:TIR domain-containing protein [Gammaproteobacteria bacterium]
MADVFVSYARSDKALVAPIVAAIEAKGWSVWWDPAIAPGQEFDGRIDAELDAAAAVLVVWTPTSVTSRWVRGEAREAAERGVLVPVRFEGARLPIDVRAIHTTDLDGWAGNPDNPACRELLGALGAMIDGQRGPGSSQSASTSSSVPAPTTPSTPRVSICVLPFSNMSGDPEQEYFSDGISEDVITDLSKVSALSVVARNTAFSFKGKTVDIPQIARQLKVSHILEGSVRKAGQRVRITAQLIDCSTGNHVWAERYDRDLNDIFALQDEISRAIVAALKLKLMPEEKKALGQRGTTNLEAYNLYLMARQHYSTGLLSDARKSDTVIRLCRGAIEIDPNYARAWALMATAQRMRLYSTGDGDNGAVAASRAIALDDNLAEAHAARGGILAASGEYEAAQAAIEAALRRDPESVDVHREAARLRFHQHRFHEAIEHWEKVSTLAETDYASGPLLITCYTAIGDDEGMRRAAERTLARAEKAVAVEADNGSAMGAVISCLVALGQIERAKEWTRRAVLIDPDNMNMRYNLACDMVIHAGDFDMALDLLGPVCAKMGRERLEWLKSDPDFDPIRGDPRFQAMVAAAEQRLAPSGGDPARTT